MESDSLPIAEALRLIRTRKGLTQAAAGRLDGAPDFRTLSHWETRRKLPSLRLLFGYLDALGLDFCDLQEALDQVRGVESPSLSRCHDRLAARLDVLERNAGRVEIRLTALELKAR